MIYQLKAFLLFIVSSLMINNASAQEKVKFATLEWQPFISAHQPNNGYTIKVITEAFSRVNYDVEIEFVTLARGSRLLELGLVDGYITPYGKTYNIEKPLLSSPFPGDTIGLLKKKSLSTHYLNSLTAPLDKYIERLTDYKLGIVSGDNTTEYFNSFPKSNIHYVSTDIDNIKNLAAGIVDFIIIGKYSAAEIITNKAPHLIDKLKFIQPIDSTNAFNIVFDDKHPKQLKIKRDFNKGLTAIRQDGTLQKINEYYGFHQDTPSNGVKENINTSKKKQLTIGTVKNNDMLRLQTLAKAFQEQHPTVEINWRIMGENTLRKRLLSDLAISDGQFDIMTIGLQELPYWSENNWIIPIENLPKEYQLTDIFENLRQSHSHQNKLYALPFYAESSVTYYRKDLFAKAGIKMPDQPTYKEILKYAKTFNNPQSEVYGICLRGKAGWGENMAFFTTMVNTYGGKWFNNNWQPQVNTTAWKSALHTYKTLLTEYGPPTPELNGYNENLSLFLKGKCAIWIDATVAASSIYNKEQSLVSTHVGITKAPIANTVNGASWLWAWSLAIPTSSNNKDIAQQFITWATSKEYTALVAKNDGWKVVPQGTRKSTYNNQNYLAVAPYAQTVLTAISNASKLNNTQQNKPYSGIQFVEIPEFSAIGNDVGELISDVIQGKATTENTLIKAQHRIEYQMALSGYYAD